MSARRLFEPIVPIGPCERCGRRMFHLGDAYAFRLLSVSELDADTCADCTLDVLTLVDRHQRKGLRFAARRRARSLA